MVASNSCTQDVANGDYSKDNLKSVESFQLDNNHQVENINKMASSCPSPLLINNGSISTKKFTISRGEPSSETDRVARYLACDIVRYVSKSGYSKIVTDSHKKILRRTVDELLVRHDLLFRAMVSKMDEDPAITEEIFHEIVNEMFRDMQFNWGRIVSVYAFAGRLAAHYSTTNPAFSDKVANLAGSYVAENLGWWVDKQGGWENFDSFFGEQKTFEDFLWKGLLYTALGMGIGALATVVAR